MRSAIPAFFFSRSILCQFPGLLGRQRIPEMDRIALPARRAPQASLAYVRLDLDDGIADPKRTPEDMRRSTVESVLGAHPVSGSELRIRRSQQIKNVGSTYAFRRAEFAVILPLTQQSLFSEFFQAGLLFRHASFTNSASAGTSNVQRLASDGESSSFITGTSPL